MKCPDCNNELKVAVLKGISIHECFRCKGKWFERNELMLAKNKVDDHLRWLDFDPFGKDAEELSVVSVGKQCPQCKKEMQSLTYAQSKVVIDKCQSCEGVWLSHGELARVILYLYKTFKSKLAKDLGGDTFKEFYKGLISEAKDFLAVLKILEIRIAVEHPTLTQSWENIESVSPFK